MDTQHNLPKWLESSLSYSEYRALTTNDISANQSGIEPLRRADLFSYVILNEARVKRIENTYSPSQEIIEAIQNIHASQTWLVITEDWCGDSAQNLPYIIEFTKLNPAINVRILLRDDNLVAMDQYQTNGTRSIPKLIIFSQDNKELSTWGPRPQEALQLVSNWKAEGKTKDEFLPLLQKWYAVNKGQALEKDFLEILASLQI